MLLVFSACLYYLWRNRVPGTHSRVKKMWIGVRKGIVHIKTPILHIMSGLIIALGKDLILSRIRVRSFLSVTYFLFIILLLCIPLFLVGRNWENNFFFRKFGGFVNDEIIQRESKELAEVIQAAGEVGVNFDQYYLVGYDPPYKPMNRRNEIWFLKTVPSEQQEHNDKPSDWTLSLFCPFIPLTHLSVLLYNRADHCHRKNGSLDCTLDQLNLERKDQNKRKMVAEFFFFSFRFNVFLMV